MKLSIELCDLTEGDSYPVTLPDGSVVTLNAECSQVVYELPASAPQEPQKPAA